MSILDIGIIQILQKQGYKVRNESTLKCWKKDDLADLIRTLENNWANALERCDNQYKILCGHHERQDKYRWHDLRENPDDKPERGKVVLCHVKEETRSYEVTGVYEFNDWFIGSAFVNNNVIAWRYIEEFEEV